jgi:hypothetical protein
MNRNIRTVFTFGLIIVLFATLLLIWASSTSHFIFTQKVDLQNISQKGPNYFQNGPAYQTLSDIVYSGKRIGQVEITAGPPHVNSSEIPILLQITQTSDSNIDSVKVAFLLIHS